LVPLLSATRSLSVVRLYSLCQIITATATAAYDRTLAIGGVPLACVSPPAALGDARVVGVDQALFDLVPQLEGGLWHQREISGSQVCGL
jgi:hypothetical protein